MSQNYDDEIYEQLEEETTQNQTVEPKKQVFMKGSVNDAIQKAQSQQKILFVFLTSENEHSSKLQKEIEDSEELIDLLTESFVSIQLEMGTENFQFFTQIFPVLVTPTIYLLSPSGEPKLVLANPKLEELVSGLVDKITGVETPMTPSVSQNFDQIVDKKESEKESIKEDDPREEEMKQIRQERKRLQDKIQEMKRIKENKQKSEKKEVKKPIIEKPKQKNEKLEKLKDEEYKKQLLDRIKKEKEKRKLENEKEDSSKIQKIEVTKKSDDPPTPKTPQNVQNPSTPIQKKVEIQQEKPKSNSTQISFRTPDGKVIRGEFQLNDKLSVCREFLASKITNSDKLQFMTLFPTKYYSSLDDNSTISELSLSNATIILTPGKEEKSKNDNLNVDSDGFLRTCPGTMYLVFSTLVDSFFGMFRGNSSPENTVQNQAQRPTTSNNSNPNTNTTSNEAPKQSNPHGSTQRRVVKKGNIHSFQDDEEKEQKWDNGNNTQFQDDHKK